jgi:hypothetical protein
VSCFFYLLFLEVINMHRLECSRTEQ